jgi:hypothetical protein
LSLCCHGEARKRLDLSEIDTSTAEQPCIE